MLFLLDAIDDTDFFEGFDHSLFSFRIFINDTLSRPISWCFIELNSLNDLIKLEDLCRNKCGRYYKGIIINYYPIAFEIERVSEYKFEFPELQTKLVELLNRCVASLYVYAGYIE